jgi:hypothetical protein
VGEPREDKDNGHIPSAVTGCLQFGEDATSMTRRLGAEAPKKKLVLSKKKVVIDFYISSITNTTLSSFTICDNNIMKMKTTLT